MMASLGKWFHGSGCRFHMALRTATLPGAPQQFASLRRFLYAALHGRLTEMPDAWTASAASV